MLEHFLRQLLVAAVLEVVVPVDYRAQLFPVDQTIQRSCGGVPVDGVNQLRRRSNSLASLMLLSMAALPDRPLLAIA